MTLKPWREIAIPHDDVLKGTDNCHLARSLRALNPDATIIASASRPAEVAPADLEAQRHHPLIPLLLRRHRRPPVARQHPRRPQQPQRPRPRRPRHVAQRAVLSPSRTVPSPLHDRHTISPMREQSPQSLCTRTSGRRARTLLPTGSPSGCRRSSRHGSGPASCTSGAVLAAWISYSTPRRSKVDSRITWVGPTASTSVIASEPGSTRAQGFSAGLSQFVASYYERLDQFRQPYYTRTVEYQFESDGGMTITVEAVKRLLFERLSRKR